MPRGCKVGARWVRSGCDGDAKGDAKVAKGDAYEVVKGDAKRVCHLPTFFATSFAPSLHLPSHIHRIPFLIPFALLNLLRTSFAKFGGILPS